ncbi:MAG: MBL fold metallo-hydrolase [Candidatus Kariarchaeaceae archaeon]|jgi:L-ascorbate metabolism protein UlaG (beta-lactamase superfamily)
MKDKIIAIGISTLIIASLGVGTVLLSNMNSSGEHKPEIIIGEKFLYYKGVNITWYGGAAFKLKTEDIVVYLDPYLMKSDSEKADIVLGSHDHIDHLSPPDVGRVADPTKTILYTPQPNQVDGWGTTVEVLEALTLKEIHYPEPGEIIEKYGVTLEFVSAYNIDKYNPFQPTQLWHPPWANWTGVIVDFGDVRIYHTGDTDHIPEMEQIDCDIALMAIHGNINNAMMTAEEAAEATVSLNQSSNLKYVVPMHYDYPVTLMPGNITVGNLKQVEIFKENTEIPVVVLKPEPYH